MPSTTVSRWAMNTMAQLTRNGYLERLRLLKRDPRYAQAEADAQRAAAIFPNAAHIATARLMFEAAAKQLNTLTEAALVSFNSGSLYGVTESPTLKAAKDLERLDDLIAARAVEVLPSALAVTAFGSEVLELTAACDRVDETIAYIIAPAQTRDLARAVHAPAATALPADLRRVMGL